MSSARVPADSPRDRPVFAVADAAFGLLAGWVTTIIVGGLLAQAYTDDPNAPTGIGARVGRVAIQRALGEQPTQPGIPLWLIAVLQILLWTGLLTGVALAVHQHGVRLGRDLGLGIVARDVPIGLGAGIGTQLVLVPLLYVPIFWLFGEQDVSGSARDLTSTPTGTFGVVLLVVVVALGAPLVEELFFRGLVFRTIEDRSGRRTAVWGSSILFGAVHFQLLQFPALVLFGLVAASLVARSGRLGPAVVAHVAFNATSVVLLLSI